MISWTPLGVIFFSAFRLIRGTKIFKKKPSPATPCTLILKAAISSSQKTRQAAVYSDPKPFHRQPGLSAPAQEDVAQ